jgi:hypothetical protein
VAFRGPGVREPSAVGRVTAKGSFRSSQPESGKPAAGRKQSTRSDLSVGRIWGVGRGQRLINRTGFRPGEGLEGEGVRPHAPLLHPVEGLPHESRRLA